MQPLPPHHDCPQCGLGHPTPEGRKAMNAHHTECCRCGEIVGDSYMLLPEVWAQTGLGYHDGVLHLRCVEALIGRQLTPADFKPGVRTNDMVFWAWERATT